MRQWAIPHGRSEPHQQRQNLAERQVQEVKAATRTLMDRSGCPKWAWLLAMTDDDDEMAPSGPGD